MNIFLITQEEPFYIPKIIWRICEGLNKEDRIVGLTILKPYHKSKNYLTWIKERIIVYSFGEFILLALLLTYVKMYEVLSNILPLKKMFSVKRVCRFKRIPLIITSDINSLEYQSRLRSFDIDILISVSATQIFKTALIEIPNKECVNVHGTLLPRHRGVMGSWWALATGDKYTGVTLHRIVEKLDSGEILLQQKIPITQNDTQFSIATKTKKISADLILMMLDQLRKHQINPIDMNVHTGNINTFPTKEQAKKFRASSKRIIKFQDVIDVIKGW
jgi:methionyl-tRNA formyltransferase